MDMILDAYEKALTKRTRQDHRHRVEHMGNWMMTPERVARAQKLGILPIANPPFLFFLSDPMVEMLQRRATEQGFPFRTLWDAGFPLSFGSDSPGYSIRWIRCATSVRTVRHIRRSAARRSRLARRSPCQRPCAARLSTPRTRASRKSCLGVSRWGSSPTSSCSVMILSPLRRRSSRSYPLTSPLPVARWCILAPFAPDQRAGH